MHIARIVAILMVGATACSAAGGRFFSLGPRPPALAGTWIDSAKTTASDSSFWILTPEGADRTLRIRVVSDRNGAAHVERDDKGYGSWYLSGDLTDITNRALCIVQRARSGSSCTHFRLDTLFGEGSPRRRLVVLGYRGATTTRDRVLLERLP